MRVRVTCAALFVSACAGAEAAPSALEVEFRTLQVQVARQNELLERLQADVLLLKEQRATPAKVAAQPSADALFAQALAAYQRGNAVTAEQLLSRFVRDFDGHTRSPDALYWLGECRLEQERFVEAVEAFESVASRFPKSDRAPEALLKLGLAYEGTHDVSRARAAFERLIKSYPGSAVADVARVRVAAVKP